MLLAFSVFEVFCLQNSLIVGMQPQVSGKVGSLVGFWVDHVRHFRRLSNISEELVVGGGGNKNGEEKGVKCRQLA